MTAGGLGWVGGRLMREAIWLLVALAQPLLVLVLCASADELGRLNPIYPFLRLLPEPQGESILLPMFVSLTIAVVSLGAALIVWAWLVLHDGAFPDPGRRLRVHVWASLATGVVVATLFAAFLDQLRARPSLPIVLVGATTLAALALPVLYWPRVAFASLSGLAPDEPAP